MGALQQFWPIIAASTLVFWVFVIRRLNRAAQPYRLEFAEKGESLLANPNLPNKMRKNIEDMLNTAFGMRRIIILSYLASPIFVFMLTFGRRYIARFMDAYDIQNIEARSAYTDFMRLHTIITLSNHPILFSLLFLEVSALVLVFVLVRVLIGGGIPKYIGPSAVISAVEEKTQAFFLGHRQPAIC